MSTSLSRNSPYLPTTLPTLPPTSTTPLAQPLIKPSLHLALKTKNISRIISRSQSRSRSHTNPNPNPDNSFSSSLLLLHTSPNQSLSAHNNLTTKRKSYDEHKTKTNQRKKKIQLMKREVKELSQMEEMLRERIRMGRENVQEVRGVYGEGREENQGLGYQREIYGNMLERGQAISLVERERFYLLEEQIRKLQIKLQAMKLQITSKNKFQSECRKMLTSVQRTVFKQKKSRQKKLIQMHSNIIKRQDDLKKRLSREKQIQRLVFQTANQKTNEQKQWLRLYSTHLFVGGILNSKVERELNRNQKIEKGFERIRVSTGVQQSEQFLEKYLVREHTYGELLDSISEKQPLLSSLQEKNERLGKQLRQLEQQDSFQTSKSAKQSSLLLNPEYSLKTKQLRKLNQKLLTYQKQKESFYQWAIKFLKKYDVISSQGEMQLIRGRLNYYQIYPRSQLEVLYKKMESVVMGVLGEVRREGEEGRVKERLMENKGEEEAKGVVRVKNVRVMTEKSGRGDGEDEVEKGEDNELEYLQEHRKNVMKELRINKFRVKTRAN